MDPRYAPPSAMVTDPVPQDTVVVDREPFFYPWSTSKVALLGGVTFGFYLIWWFWTQWRADAPTEGRGSTLLKVVFSGFFVYSMARQVKEAALPLVPVQSTINRVSREAGVQPAVGWRWWEVVLGVVLGLFCLMSVAGLLLSAAATE